MIEKIRSVGNPLTIIAIFAALAEIAGAVTLPIVDKSLQATYIWFVMGFPVLLVITFFATLNLNPTVLYAPSDYKNEDNFLSTVRRGRDFAQSLDDLNDQLEVAKTQIVEQLKQEAGHIGEAERKRISAVAIKQIDLLRNQVESARESGQEFAATAAAVAGPHSQLQAVILNVLDTSAEAVPLSAISSVAHINEDAVGRALAKLTKRGLVERQPGEPEKYRRAR